MSAVVKKSSPKKTAVKKKATVKKKAVVKKSAAPKKKAAVKSRAAKKITITASERRQMIAEAAYYIAEKRNFLGGEVHNDWIDAEKQIDASYTETTLGNCEVDN